jgi:hypothetical protein
MTLDLEPFEAKSQIPHWCPKDPGSVTNWRAAVRGHVVRRRDRSGSERLGGRVTSLGSGRGPPNGDSTNGGSLLFSSGDGEVIHGGKELHHRLIDAGKPPRWSPTTSTVVSSEEWEEGICGRSCCAPGSSRISRPCSPSASTTRPMASRRAAGCTRPTRLFHAHHQRHRRRLGHGPVETARVDAAGRRPRLPRPFPPGQARGQAVVCPLAQSDDNQGRQPGHHVRQPGQTPPRVQAPIAQRPARHRPVQPAARKPGPADAAAHRFFRRQGGPGVPIGHRPAQKGTGDVVRRGRVNRVRRL